MFGKIGDAYPIKGWPWETGILLQSVEEKASLWGGGGEGATGIPGRWPTATAMRVRLESRPASAEGTQLAPVRPLQSDQPNPWIEWFGPMLHQISDVVYQMSQGRRDAICALAAPGESRRRFPDRPGAPGTSGYSYRSARSPALTPKRVEQQHRFPADHTAFRSTWAQGDRAAGSICRVMNHIAKRIVGGRSAERGVEITDGVALRKTLMIKATC